MRRHERPLAIVCAIIYIAIIVSVLIWIVAVNSNHKELSLSPDRDADASTTNDEVVLNGGSDDGSQAGGSDSTPITNGEDAGDED